MNAESSEKVFLVALVVFVVLLFVLIQAGLAKFLLVGASGWSRLVTKFPNQTEEPLLQLRGQYGSRMSGIEMGSILILSVCPSGLRVGMRFFGFSIGQNFFVPWESLSVTRSNVSFKNILFGPTLSRQTAEIKFGRPLIGSLIVPAQTADQLARAATTRWPETGSSTEES